MLVLYVMCSKFIMAVNFCRVISCIKTLFSYSTIQHIEVMMNKYNNPLFVTSNCYLRNRMHSPIVNIEVYNIATCTSFELTTSTLLLVTIINFMI
jgi:hypothetical protein